jgi:uncharacterized CHY-type Zn-finger protein
MSKSAHDLLVRGVAAAKAGSKNEARFYLEKMLMIDASHAQRIEAWVWLSEVSDDPVEKRRYLETALANNPAHPTARRKLAVLNGRLKPEEIVDPDRLPTFAPERPQSTHARRFVCQQCGGRMTFTPDGKSLTCAYCNRCQTLSQALEEGAMDTAAVEEQDFLVALATAKGHTRPVATQSIRCQGCGAAFVLSPRMLSSRCPYCESAYVVEETKVQELIPPEGVIPFAVSRKEAHRATLRWLKTEGLSTQSLIAPPAGVYFPVWTFDVGGEILWRGLEYEDDRWVPRTGTKAVYKDDLVVPASHALPPSVGETMSEFRLDEVVPYDPAYLADWPAETYEISVSDASLVARHRTFSEAREKIPRGFFGRVKDLKLSSTRLIIESFKLVLLPLWIAHYRNENENENGKRKRYTIVVNGQTGTVRGEKPPQGLRKLWAWLMGNE